MSCVEIRKEGYLPRRSDVRAHTHTHTHTHTRTHAHTRRGRRPEEAENGFMFKFFSSCHEIRILFHQSLDTYFPPSTPRPGICGKGCDLAFPAPGTTARPFRHVSSISSRNRPKAKASPYKPKTSFACLMFCFGNKNEHTEERFIHFGKMLGSPLPPFPFGGTMWLVRS